MNYYCIKCKMKVAPVTGILYHQDKGDITAKMCPYCRWQVVIEGEEKEKEKV